MATSLSIGLAAYNMLSSSTELTEQVTAIYPVVSAVEAVLPYVAYRVSGSDCTPTKSLVSSDSVSMEVTVWANTYQECVEIAESVRAALDYKCGDFGGLQVRSCTFSGQGAEDFQDDAFYKILNFTIKI